MVILRDFPHDGAFFWVGNIMTPVYCHWWVFSLSVCWGWETYRLGVRCAVWNTTQSSPWLISSQIMALKTADWGRKCQPPGHSDAEVLAGQLSWSCFGVDVVCPEWQGLTKLGYKTKLTPEGLYRFIAFWRIDDHENVFPVMKWYPMKLECLETERD